MQYNCQKSSNSQGLSHFSRIFGKNDKIPGFFQAGKTVTIFQVFQELWEPWNLILLGGHVPAVPPWICQ